MTFMFYLSAAVLASALFIYLFLRVNPAALATALRNSLLFILLAATLLAAVFGRTGLSMMLAMASIGAFRQFRRSRSARRSTGQTSTVRTAALEMTLFHDSGDLAGLILAGSHEGRELAELSDAELFELYGELKSDEESCQLLEAYLDRRMAGWRDSTQANTDAGQGASASSGTMTKQEAYQILGLEEGASVAAIRKAHRNLMQRVHPDHGGSSFLAARINQAKDVLLAGH